uniref:Uncharacterized protein n=1 Tax=Spongospora subterranea TaxID=70186 RepID=A0A0H5R310_9EUKA|eukprot:CRZ08296.1 hypothetical protein [Spongospora subterranea]
MAGHQVGNRLHRAILGANRGIRALHRDYCCSFAFYDHSTRCKPCLRCLLSMGQKQHSCTLADSRRRHYIKHSHQPFKIIDPKSDAITVHLVPPAFDTLVGYRSPVNMGIFPVEVHLNCSCQSVLGSPIRSLA